MMAEPDPLLHQFLSDRDAPCPKCGYNLRGLEQGACPECGSEVELSVGLSEPRIGAFVAGAVGLGAGIGFNTFILGFMVWVSLFSHRGGPRLADAVPLVLGLAVTGIAMLQWCRRRKKIRKMAAAMRWALATGCFILSLGSAVLFFSVVR